MATQQRRLLHATTSKLGKIEFTELTRVLRKEVAWLSLPAETREQLYTLLPEPRDSDAAKDADLHPLKGHYRPYIEAELRRWQEDLREGREVAKWRLEAIQASHDRASGSFDEWTEMSREQYWGKRTGPKVMFKGQNSTEGVSRETVVANGNGLHGTKGEGEEGMAMNGNAAHRTDDEKDGANVKDVTEANN